MVLEVELSKGSRYSESPGGNVGAEVEEVSRKRLCSFVWKPAKQSGKDWEVIGYPNQRHFDGVVQAEAGLEW